MTLEEIIASDKTVLVPKDIAPVLHCDPYCISIMARDAPEKLGFPVIRIGRTTKIPRLAFLRFLGVEKAEYREKTRCEAAK